MNAPTQSLLNLMPEVIASLRAEGMSVNLVNKLELAMAEPATVGQGNPVGFAHADGKVDWFDPIPEEGAHIYAAPATVGQDRVCNNDECCWTGQTDRMCGGVGPLCPDCGETTEPMPTPVAAQAKLVPDALVHPPHNPDAAPHAQFSAMRYRNGWKDCRSAMLAAQAAQPAATADVQTVIRFIFDRFGAPGESGELPEAVVQAVRRLEVSQPAASVEPVAVDAQAQPVATRQEMLDVAYGVANKVTAACERAAVLLRAMAAQDASKPAQVVKCNCPGGNKPVKLHAPNCPVRMSNAAIIDPYDGGTFVAAQPAQDERDAFEAWAITQGYLLHLANNGDGYKNLRTEGAWIAWQARAALSAPQVEGDAQLFVWLRDQSCDLRCVSEPTGGDDADVRWLVIEHHMAKPHEREIGRSITDNPREAIRAAIAAMGKGGEQ